MGKARLHRTTRRAVTLGGVLLCAAGASAATAADNSYVQTNLVSDQAGHALVQDPNLVNAWGLSASPTSPIWVANNGTETSSLYTGFNPAPPVNRLGLLVSIPGGAPTGTVFNAAAGSGAFPVTDGTVTAPAAFLFDTEDGAVVGWNPTVGLAAGQSPPSTTGEVALTTPGANYKGLALGITNQGARLYAANFTQMRIDVWDGDWMPAAAPGAFVDPSLPSDYGPFNVQVIGKRLYVAYAQVDPESGDEVAGSGKGFVDVYTLQGKLVSRLISHDGLNAPWGLAKAPGNFGAFGHALLVGNFGNGRIHAYDIHTGAMLGTLQDPGGSPIVIDGLWALRFGNGTFGTHRTLIFSAGPDDESHGLLGALNATG
jgi:uncharacterized protein (TIGR03118 family)